MLIQEELKLKIRLRECVISDEEVLDFIKNRIYVNKYYTDEKFKAQVLEICNQKPKEQSQDTH